MGQFKWSVRITSPVRLLVLLLVSVFIGELAIMYFINFFPSLAFWQKALIDASLVISMVFPVMYCFLFRPLVSEIEKRTLAETILRKGEERYRNIFENVQDVYYEVTPDGIITELSPSVSIITKGQYTRFDLLGSSVYDMYGNPADRDVLYSLLVEKGEVRDYEVRLKNRDGSEVNCSVMAKIFLDINGQPRKITGGIRDISLRKKAEEELKIMNEELKKAISEKDRMFSIISHDLRGPLSTFITLSEIMAQGDTILKPLEMQKFSDSMHRSATGLYGLLENLLLWSRSKMNQLPCEPAEVNLKREAEEVISLLTESAARKEILIICKIPVDLKMITDINSLHTVFRNLASNAIKFTRRGGNIVINASRWGNDKVEITITDDGIGMSMEMVSSLFSLEAYNNRPGTEGEPSTGLGLLLCKELVEKNGGRITVESEVDKGTTFRIYMMNDLSSGRK